MFEAFRSFAFTFILAFDDVVEEAFEPSDDVAETNRGLLDRELLWVRDRLLDELLDFAEAERDRDLEGDRDRSDPEFFFFTSELPPDEEEEEEELADDDLDDILADWRN